MDQPLLGDAAMTQHYGDCSFGRAVRPSEAGLELQGNPLPWR